MGARSRFRLQALLLAALVAAAFAPVARNGFVNYDDDLLIRENPQVRRGLSVATARWALASTEDGNWLPLARLSHLADVSLFGMRPGAHHLVSVAWHAGAVVALFAALRAMTGAAWRSFAAAGIFAVHPLQVESVAWAAERKSVLAGFLFALTLLLWARYARRPGPGRYGAAVAAGALAMAAKPALMALPFVLALLDFWPLGRMREPGGAGRGSGAGRVFSRALALRRLPEQAPLLAAAAGTGAIALAAHQAAGAVGLLHAYPLGVRLGNAALSCARYLATMAWPADLAVFYPHPGSALPWGRAAAAGLLAALLAALALAAARRRPWLAVGWLWFLVLLAPTIGIVQFAVHARADRYAYLPLAGVAVALVWSAADLLRGRRRGRAVLGALAASALVALAGATAAQARLWRDSPTLFRHAIAATGRNWSAEFSLALALHGAGRPAEAVESYRAAMRDFPYDRAFIAEAYVNLGNALRELRRDGEAAEAYREAARLSGHGGGRTAAPAGGAGR